MVRMLEKAPEIVAAVIVLIVVIVAVVFLNIKEGCAINDIYETYNNGLCLNCGGHYVFKQAIGHQYDTGYLYQCDRCGQLVELDAYRGN